MIESFHFRNDENKNYHLGNPPFTIFVVAYVANDVCQSRYVAFDYSKASRP